MKIYMHRFMWTTLLLSAGHVLSAPARKEREMELTGAWASASVFLAGNDLGVVSIASKPTLMGESRNAVKAAAAVALMDIFQARLGLTGRESIHPIASQPIRVDVNQRAHVRLKQYVDGLPVEGASLAIHFDAMTGQVLAVNGEAHSSDSIVYADKGASLRCEAAMELALVEYLSDGSTMSIEGAWIHDCEFAAVQGKDGKAYLAYKRLYETRLCTGPRTDSFPNSSSSLVGSVPYRVDLIFADRITGHLVAVHPKIIRARSMKTYNCTNQREYLECVNVTESADKINTGDPALDDAHNNAVDAYDFYQLHFGLTGMDGNDSVIQTMAHFGLFEYDAWFSPLYGGMLVYGDGDPDGNNSRFGYFGRFDTVVHEFSHGVTYFSSKLAGTYESGALDEAFSDVMAATAERLVKNKPAFDVWHMGEEIDRRGVGLRSLANPPDFGKPDYFAHRLTAAFDYGSVHDNSGIMSKAFYLMVEGGTHPLSGIVVPPLNTDFDLSIKKAATIFYNANTNCLTEGSDFVTMRECTLQFASSSEKSTVRKAWDAIGVKEILPLVAGVRFAGINLPINHDVQVFKLDKLVNRGEKVTCSLSSDTIGDADLAVRFGHPPINYPLNENGGNDCFSTTSTATETCTTGASPNTTTVFVAVEAFYAATDLQLVCIVCKALGTRCATKAQCCNPTLTTCDGTTTSNRICKACKATAARCTRPAECCGTQACDGTSTSNRICKACKAATARCTRPTECCGTQACDGTTTSTRVCKACKVAGTSCTRPTECCGTQACDGTTTSNRICKACKATATRCARPTECCGTQACDGTSTSTRVCKACKVAGTSCTRATECCGSLVCDGTTTSNRVCKACKARQGVCTLTSQCCAGLRCTSLRCA